MRTFNYFYRVHSTLALISSILLGVVMLCNNVYAEQFKIVIAADMPDITDPDSGRYAQLKQLLDDQKKNEQAPFFIFGGSSIGPSAMSAFDRGSHIIDILNSLEPDVMGITKREFSYFEDELSLRAYEAAFPIVNSNATDKRISDTPDGLIDELIISKNDIKLGFISVINQGLIEEYLLSNIEVEPPQLSIRKKAKSLKRQGADLIVLHYSFPFDFVPQLINDGSVDLAILVDDNLQDNYRQLVENNDKIMLLERRGEVLIVDMDMTSFPAMLSKERVRLSGYSPDNLVQNQVNAYRLRLNRLLDEQVGFWDNDYTTEREEVRGKENAFANFIVDAMRDFGNADIAMLNGGSIRGDRKYSKLASITRRDLTTELPFRSSLRVVSISGSDLLQALEIGFSKVEDLKGNFPHVSGMKIRYDSSKEPGERVVSVQINNRPLDQNKTYVLAITDYLHSGGDGFTPLKNSQPTQLTVNGAAILILDLTLRTIRTKGKLDSQVSGRITDVASK